MFGVALMILAVVGALFFLELFLEKCFGFWSCGVYSSIWLGPRTDGLLCSRSLYFVYCLACPSFLLLSVESIFCTNFRTKRQLRDASQFNFPGPAGGRMAPCCRSGDNP